MTAHIRANLVLLVSTVLVCCVLYPAAMYAVGRGLFPTAASGSLITEPGPDGKEVVKGSRLIAQPFTSDEYFWSRPSAASYNATASGASNWGANNPKLRDRVSQFLGPIVQYKKNSRFYTGADPEKAVQKDIEVWFAAKPDRVADWAGEFDLAVGNWAKTDFAAKTDTSDEKYGLQGEFILAWAKDHPEVISDWKASNPTKTDDPKPEDLAVGFFASFAKIHPGKWPGVVDVEQPDKTKVQRIEPVSSDSAISANLFELWLRDPANATRVADLEPVAADMVMASGSGLDPDITQRNALSVYQLDRVAKARTAPGADSKKVRDDITALVKKRAFTPLGGLVGEPLVNVLELNRELDANFPVPAPSK